MSNLLAIPLKKTYPIDIKGAVRSYITGRGGAHPDEFKQDIKTWQDLRKYVVGGFLQESEVESAVL